MAAVMPDYKRPNRPVIIEIVNRRVLREFERVLPTGTVEQVVCKRMIGLDENDKAWKYIVEMAWIGDELVRALDYGYFRQYEKSE